MYWDFFSSEFAGFIPWVLPEPRPFGLLYLSLFHRRKIDFYVFLHILMHLLTYPRLWFLRLPKKKKEIYQYIHIHYICTYISYSYDIIFFCSQKVSQNQKKVQFRPWSSRIDYFENKRQNLSSHLQLVFSKCLVFVKITSK